MGRLGGTPLVGHGVPPLLWVEAKAPSSAPGASFLTVGKTTVSRQRLSRPSAQSSLARLQVNPFSRPGSGPDEHEPPMSLALSA